jgi:hypothetical protein
MSTTRRLRHIFCFAIAGGIALVGAAPAMAQLPQARLFSIFPCGGKAGTTVELSLTTVTDLDEADRLLFNHPGITAVPKTTDAGGKKKPVPNVFEVTIRPDVPSGIYEIYAGGLFGLSNPRVFVVGTQDESREAEPNNDPEKANPLTLGHIVDGTSGGATDVDYFRFSGQRGQHIVAVCRASDLDSRISPVIEISTADGRRLGYAREELRHDPAIDVVLPDDGEYLVKVHDFLFRGGPEYIYRLAVGTFPHIDFVMPPAGVAGSTGHFTLYGRNLPGGKPAGMSVEGRPLDKLDVTISLPSVAPIAPAQTTLRSVSAGVKTASWTLKTPAGESNPVLIQLARSTPIVEKEPNDTPALAQTVSAPGEFAGQFQAPGDTDYFTFHADAGQVFYIDVFADRIESLADPVLIVEQVVRDAKGNETASRITSMDDDNSNVAPAVFDTRTDDPTYRFQARETGTYRIQLRDRSFESRGDPRLVYRVSIRPEEPDFQLVVLPQYPKQGTVKEVSTWAIGLRKGDSREVEILVLRRDGFREPIEVWAEKLPKGVTCRGTSIASNAKTAELIFTAVDDAPEGVGFIRVMGKAKVPSRAPQEATPPTEIVHEAIPATIVWSAAIDAPAVSRIGQSLALSVMKESAPFALSSDLARIEVNQSRQVLLPLSLARRNGFDGEVAMTLVGATPAALDLTIKSFPKGKSSELVRFFVPRTERPGTLTLYWKTQAPVAYRRNPFAEERAKAEEIAATKEAAAAASLLKTARGELDQAIKKQNQLAETLKIAKSQLGTAKVQRVSDAQRKSDTQKLAALQATLKEVTQARQKAAARVAETSANSQAAAARKSAADRELAQATKTATPQNLTDFAASTPILVTVKAAPIDLKAAVPNGGSLKKGSQISVKVDVKRRKGFTGPVTLGLLLLPGVQGIDAKPVIVPAGKNSGVLLITAKLNAPQGPLANMAVRAQMDFEGKAEVDAPIGLKVVP